MPPLGTNAFTAASRKGTGVPNGSMSMKSKYVFEFKLYLVASNSCARKFNIFNLILLCAAFFLISFTAVGLASFAKTFFRPTSFANRIARTPVADNKSKIAASLPNKQEVNSTEMSRLTICAGLKNAGFLAVILLTFCTKSSTLPSFTFSSIIELHHDKQLATLLDNLMGGRINLCRPTKYLAIHYIELRTMPRAGHNIAIANTIPKRAANMCASSIDTVEFSIDIEDCNPLALHREKLSFSRYNI